MFKWLFCKHDYDLVGKYYYITDEDCRNVIYAYEVFKCNSCGNSHSKEILRFEEIDNRIQSLKECIQKLESKGFQCEVDYRLNTN